MQLKLIIDTKKSLDGVGDKIHESMVGHGDYIDSNVVLNVDSPLDPTDPTVVGLFVDLDTCRDKEFVRQKAKDAIDLFIDSL